MRPPTPERRFSILVVENETDVRWFMKKAFQAHINNLELHEAESPQEASILAGTLKPHLIVMEVFFSTVGLGSLAGSYFGPWLIKKIRAETPDSKIIVCSMIEDGDYGDWFVKDLGVDAYFQKPYKLEDVVEKSMELLGLPYGEKWN